MGVLDSDVRTRAELARSIEARGGAVVVDSPPRPDTVDLLRRMGPDAVVLAAEDALEPADALTAPLALGASTAMVLLTSPVSARTLRLGRTAGVMAVLLRPLRAIEVGPTLDVAVARFRELRRFKQALADRGVVEQAKARLMVLDGLTEGAAFGWLRRRAMEQRIRIGEVARAVLAREGV